MYVLVFEHFEKGINLNWKNIDYNVTYIKLLCQMFIVNSWFSTLVKLQVPF